MKRIMSIALCLVLALSLAACGQTAAPAATTAPVASAAPAATEAPAAVKLSGTVATDGSTSMEKVIGALSESFMARRRTALPLTTIPPAPAPASPPCRRAPATSACPPVR